MAATGLQLNWTSVSHNSVNLTRVTQVSFDQGGELISFQGDNNRYPVVIANAISRPKASVTTGDVATLMNIAVGTTGSFIATQKDAVGSSGGDIVFTLINAVHESSQDSGQWGQFASGTASFQAYSSDGSTSPLSFSRS